MTSHRSIFRYGSTPQPTYSEDQLLAMAADPDPDVHTDAAVHARDAHVHNAVLREICNILDATAHLDTKSLGILITEGMPYTAEEALKWVPLYGVAHAVAMTTEFPGKELSKLLAQAGVPQGHGKKFDGPRTIPSLHTTPKSKNGPKFGSGHTSR